MSETTMYILYSGYGIDGGFGDYSGVSWSNEPVKIEGETVWFDDYEVAQNVVKKLNAKSSEKFYSTGFHSAYDGNFPMEYKIQKIEIPRNSSFDENALDLVSEKDVKKWISEDYDYDNDEYLDYENFLNENNLPMDSNTYELWLKEFNND